MSSKLVASFVNKENAIALKTALSNEVRHLWVMIMQPRPSHQFYDVEVQHASDSPCSQEQFDQCLETKNKFVNIVEEPIPEVVESPATVKSETNAAEQIRL